MSLRHYPKGSAKRLEILDAALEVFTIEGYRATSLRGIAERAHITPAGIMHYFDSKEQLLSAVLQHRDAMDVRRADLDTPTDPVESLAQVMDANMKVPGLVTLYLTIAAAAVDPQHPAHDYLERRYHRLAGGLTTWITEMSQAGLVPQVVNPRRRGHGNRRPGRWHPVPVVAEPERRHGPARAARRAPTAGPALWTSRSPSYPPRGPCAPPCSSIR
ncbi:helix-turn-helix domain-containing protein [Propionibacterium freudenreichii]|uniref:TetR/AcrR family transcriptional regulator n=1 Tax=Propionibacterium freudenreichii TaxID=1744 RepID=UPI000BC35B89|nr:TetR/AcrR family transcriptional regulator [Propionibacterium freudenreichii]MDK9296009.1 TetR/AcrR family transcriptional regulator [Propionibacterium freudenreichii]MDK9361402.1 TetR/AcrR family transcriptional regulator [Propionibacterium freudenreichii]MDK9640350.1 TetR/AcrR family transcriptional regulator [Propionibacterium freudenreichii]MDK9660709.1 TetR/AcrR family transcriptional regulator [Propionibacterium freudenreichii]WGU89983.1 helix-turn-helix domain-containing protein [Pro